jgi:pSer/pThr/pTyr-binding forkhead associated (FHA) protein
MRLVVKQDNHTVSELRFDKGPVYIGRHADSQVLLPDRAVSRQHAVIFSTNNGKWIVEDLDSANKTYLNDEAIHKAEIETGDSLRIVDFTIEVDLESEAAVSEVEADTTVGRLEADTVVGKVESAPAAGKPIGSEDTATTASLISRGEQIIIRKVGAEKAPPIRFAAERAVDFLQATEAISKADSLDKVLLALLDIIAKQFNPRHIWCALREQPGGPMTCHAGKERNGQAVELSELDLNEKVTEAIEKDEFLLFLFSRDLSVEKKEQIRSVLIAPVKNRTGCYGVLYADNTFRDDHYNLGDLDYLMLLGIHTATILEKL